MSFVTPYVVDRRVYDKRGNWKSPNQDVAEPIFYFVKENLTLASSYISGREELKETMTIVVFGSKPIVQYDEITLENGRKWSVQEINYNYNETNILVKDMIKSRIVSMEIVLE